VGLVSLTSSPYSSELIVLGRGLVCLQGFAMCVCVCVLYINRLPEDGPSM